MERYIKTTENVFDQCRGPFYGIDGCEKSRTNLMKNFRKDSGRFHWLKSIKWGKRMNEKYCSSRVATIMESKNYLV